MSLFGEATDELVHRFSVLHCSADGRSVWKGVVGLPVGPHLSNQCIGAAMHEALEVGMQWVHVLSGEALDGVDHVTCIVTHQKVFLVAQMAKGRVETSTCKVGTFGEAFIELLQEELI